MGRRNNYRNIELGGDDDDDDDDDNSPGEVDPKLFAIDDLQFTSSEDDNALTNPHQRQSQQQLKAAATTNKNHEESSRAFKNDNNDATYQIRQDESLLAILRKNSAHPFVCIAHLFFKIASLVLYIVGGWFVGGTHGVNFVVFSTLIILLVAVDFYVTQKISGRFLVGLRWHNILQEDGIHTTWIFESREEDQHISRVNTFDRIIFWSTLYIHPFLWFLFLFLDLMKLNLSWLIPCAVACTLTMTNLYGFYRCSKDQQQRLHSMMLRGAQFGVHGVTSLTQGTGLITNMLSSFVNRTTNRS